MIAVEVEDEKVVVEVEVDVTSVDVVEVGVVEEELIDDHVCLGTYHRLDFDINLEGRSLELLDHTVQG